MPLFRKKKTVTPEPESFVEEPIMDVTGLDGGVKLFTNRVVLYRSGGSMKRSMYGWTGEKTIPLSSITAIQLGERGRLHPGYIDFTVAGASMIDTSRTGVPENRMQFTTDEQLRLFRELKDRMESILFAPGKETTSGKQGGASVADEIHKLASLRDQGIITSSEFERQKTKLLG